MGLIPPGQGEIDPTCQTILVTATPAPTPSTLRIRRLKPEATFNCGFVRRSWTVAIAGAI
jgi:hypothetical protein